MLMARISEHPAIWKDFGSRVRRLRRDAGLTQAELCDSLASRGVRMHHTTLAKLENGGRPTPVDEVIGLAQVLGAPYSELLPSPGGPDEEPDLVMGDLILTFKRRHRRLEDSARVYEAQMAAMMRWLQGTAERAATDPVGSPDAE